MAAAVITCKFMHNENADNGVKFGPNPNSIYKFEVTHEKHTSQKMGEGLINSSISDENALQHRDVVDATVGTVGIAATALATFGIISNPIGWGIGLGVLLYGAGTLIYDSLKD